MASKTKASKSKKETLDLYRKMLVVRRFEEEAARAYSQGKIGGFLHLYIGQEAVAVGTVAALNDDDYVLTTYRDHGLALARGMTSRACMAELYGKATGCSRGLGGSMHMFDVEHNFLGGHAIVGGHCALGAGMAFKSHYLNENRVTVCFFGEGATNIGGFHEALTLASLWKLPCIFVCENNEYAMGTSVARSSPVTEMAKKALAYAMPSAIVEGHDLDAVIEAIAAARDRGVRKEGPTFIEMKTYRFRGHSMSDPGKYRTPEELEERKKSRDPLVRTRQALLDGGAKEDEIKSVEASVESEVEDAVKFAEESPAATEDSMFRYIYAQAES